MTEEEIMRNLSAIEYYKEQLGSIDMQVQYLQAAMNDYQKAKVTIEQLGKVKGVSEMLVPVGLGVFVSASTKDTSKVLVDIGAGIVAEKTVEDAVKKIESRIGDLQKSQERLYSMANQIQHEAEELSEKTQRMMAETKQRM